MANILTIIKQTGNFFTLDLTADTVVYPQVISDQNRLLTHGTLCDFKTANGANLVKKQNIDVTEIILIASGTFTFVSTFELWSKLKEVGFFDGLNSGGGGGSVIDRFDELLDTFPYVGNDGYVPVVNISQQKLVATPFYNVRNFLDLEDVLATALVADKMVVVSSDGLGLILVDQPTTPPNFLNAVGSFHYSDSGVTQNILPNTVTKITNNGAGAFTTSANAPYGVSSVWNTTTNQFDFSQLSIGDELVIRIETSLDTTQADQTYSFKINFAIGSPNPFSLGVTQGQFKTTSPYIVVEDVSFDISNINTKNYPAELVINTDNNATVVVNGFYIAIVRKNVNIVDVNTNVNLSATQSASNITIVNSGGDDAVLLPVSNSLAGLMLPADKIKLDSAGWIYKSSNFQAEINKQYITFGNFIVVTDPVFVNGGQGYSVYNAGGKVSFEDGSYSERPTLTYVFKDLAGNLVYNRISDVNGGTSQSGTINGFDTIQVRKDTITNWNVNNPTLALNEIGFYENNFRVGDGLNSWNLLSDFVKSGIGWILKTSNFIPVPNNNYLIQSTGNIPVSSFPSGVLGDVIMFLVGSGTASSIGGRTYQAGSLVIATMKTDLTGWQYAVITDFKGGSSLTYSGAVLQLRKDTSSNWTANNPFVLAGELCFETDTNKFKVGTATNQNWNDTPYTAIGLEGKQFTHTILESDWTFVVDKYKATFNDASITFDSVVNIVPVDETTFDFIAQAQFFPFTTTQSSTVEMWSKYKIPVDVDVVINVINNITP